VEVTKYSIEKLSRSHNRDDFSCGIVELDNYLKNDARRHNSSGINHTKVLVEKGCKDIIGFFSFAATSVMRESFPMDKKLPNYDIPCFRLTRFGIDLRYQKKGLGEYLLFCALIHASEMSQNIGAYAVVVDAKNESAKSFYRKNGFYELSGLIVYLPIKEISRVMSRV
jgi:ribosomal protein S18 acetylase RimI-like enzyme